MKKLNHFFKIKQVKMGAIIICILSVLAVAFIFQSETNNNPGAPLAVDGSEESSAGIVQQTAPEEESVDLPSQEGASENTKNSSQTHLTVKTEGSTQEQSLIDGDNSPTQSSSNNESGNQPETMSEQATDSKESPMTDHAESSRTDSIESSNTDSTESSTTTTATNDKKNVVTFSIRCDTILNNLDKFSKEKLSVLPSSGVIIASRSVEFDEGESVFDVLKRETHAAKVHLEFVYTPLYNSVYIEGIHNIYEFDCGELSGWTYKVNGVFPGYGCAQYTVKNGDVIEWVYTCDLGRDVGAGF